MHDETATEQMTRAIVVKAYAEFCARMQTHAGELAAKRFAVEVTESSAKAYHGLDSTRLEQMLVEEFGDKH